MPRPRVGGVGTVREHREGGWKRLAAGKPGRTPSALAAMLLGVVQVLEERSLEVVVVVGGAAPAKVGGQPLDDAHIAPLRRVAHDAETVGLGKGSDERPCHHARLADDRGQLRLSARQKGGRRRHLLGACSKTRRIDVSRAGGDGAEGVVPPVDPESLADDSLRGLSFELG